MVRAYTDTELINIVGQLQGFRGIPYYLLIGVRSKEDTFDVFDDKFYFFVNGEFYAMTTGTTNPGGKSLLGGWRKVNTKGSAIIKSNEIYYDVYEYGLHKGKMPALRQRFGPVGNMKYYRDGNDNKKVDELGIVYTGVYNTNFHFNNYDIKTKIKSLMIGGWSEGCQVANDSEGYNKIINKVAGDRRPVTYALIKET